METECYKVTSYLNLSIFTSQYGLRDQGGFVLEYAEDRPTVKLPGSLGISVFDTIENAIDYTNAPSFRGFDYKIFKSIGYGEVDTHKEISGKSGFIHMFAFYADPENKHISLMPDKKGGLWFDSVQIVSLAKYRYKGILSGVGSI